MSTTKRRSYKKDKPGGTRQRTIAIELHRQWRKLERKGDAEVIAEKLGVSKPTISKALIYGCVHQQTLIDGINKYFEDRLTAEREQAAKLNQLNPTNGTEHTPLVVS